MLTRCPNCGAGMSLDALIAQNGAHIVRMNDGMVKRDRAALKIRVFWPINDDVFSFRKTFQRIRCELFLVGANGVHTDFFQVVEGR